MRKHKIKLIVLGYHQFIIAVLWENIAFRVNIYVMLYKALKTFECKNLLINLAVYIGMSFLHRSTILSLTACLCL